MKAYERAMGISSSSSPPSSSLSPIVNIIIHIRQMRPSFPR
jgi:hypothetical protein